MHHGRQVGRTWGRDEKGKINHATYLSSNQKNEEDLFVLHSQQLDRKRDKKWENSKEQRIDFIKNQMEILEEEEIFLEDNYNRGAVYLTINENNKNIGSSSSAGSRNSL